MPRRAAPSLTNRTSWTAHGGTAPENALRRTAGRLRRSLSDLRDLGSLLVTMHLADELYEEDLEGIDPWTRRVTLWHYTLRNEQRSREAAAQRKAKRAKAKAAAEPAKPDQPEQVEP
jgi:hypothetical protein